MLRVAAYVLNGNGLAEKTVPMLAEGAKCAGETVIRFTDRQYTDQHPADFDAAIFWGYVNSCQAIMRGYRGAGKAAVYLDLAYWDRQNCYKVSVNSRHPVEYFQLYKHDDSRRKKFVKELLPYRQRDNILVAGMGSKAAWAEKLEPLNSWETNAIAEIKRHTDRPIHFRPKTPDAPPIPGSTYSPGIPLSVALASANVVVTHHSNVAVDGLINGAPAFAFAGVSSVIGLQDLSKIETPLYSDHREQWLNDVAYCQWSIKELRDGTCWNHLKSEGII